MKNIAKIRKILTVSALAAIMTTSIGFANEPTKLIPSGKPVGISQTTKVIYVVDTLQDTKLKKDDIILLMRDSNATKVYTHNDLQSLYKQPNKEIVLSVQRDNKVKTFKCTTDDLRNCLLSNTVNFIGTITAMDKEGNFVGLAHNVNIGGIGLNRNMIEKSELTEVEYVKDKKSKMFNLGSLEPVFGETIKGEITDYAENGILGNITSEKVIGEGLDIGEPKVGKAYIYCVSPISNEMKMHEIEITKVKENYSNIEVIDKTLLKHRGGLVSGMSGSPIIQDGKIVGGVRGVNKSSTKSGSMTNIHAMLNGNNPAKEK